MESLALYIHVPYCLEKCPYCDFHSVATAKSAIPEERYAECLIKQLEWEVNRLDLRDRQLVSIYFGGGTPSLMSPKFFERILQLVPGSNCKSAYSWSQAPEITVETNPATASQRHFKEWLELGIHRISFGTQSFQDSLLKRLGRHHSAAHSFQAVRDAFSAGFSNVSCDLIFGIEGQTLKELEFDLQTLVLLQVPHVSAYQLTVEPNTPLAHWVSEGKYQLPKEPALIKMHERVVEVLEAGGLKRYEISNYAKPGFESRHNLQYWRYQDYLGIGSGAVSKIGNRRWRTTRKLKDYLAGDWNYEEEEVIDPKTAWKERWMMGIRLTEGILLEEKEAPWRGTLDLLEKEGFLKKRGERVHLTPKGFMVTSQITKNVFELIDKV